MSLDPHEDYFELSDVLVNRGLIDQSLYFEIFDPTPFWNKAKAKGVLIIIKWDYGMPGLRIL